MNSIYKLMLNNKAFDDIIENLINKKNVAIIKRNEELNEIINYFNDFIINKFDKKRLYEIINEIEQDDNDGLWVLEMMGFIWDNRNSKSFIDCKRILF